jgi:hypothetical protein
MIGGLRGFGSWLSQDGRSGLAGYYRGFWLCQGIGIASESDSGSAVGALPIIGEVGGMAVGALLFEAEVLAGGSYWWGAAL